MAEKLTDARVRAAKPRDKRYSIMDAREPGLELRVHIDGRRVFALRRSVGGKDLRVTLGEYGPPPMLSLEGARSQAAELKIKFRTQGDFRDREQREAEERRLREAYTIENLAADWVTHAKNRLRASTMALHEHRIAKHIIPALGAKSIEAVTRADVRALVTALGEGGKHRTGNCVAALISQLYRFARNELEHDVQNPAADMRPFEEKVRERILTEDEIRAFWTGLEDPTLPPGPCVAIALKFALFSCQRRGEIAGIAKIADRCARRAEAARHERVREPVSGYLA